MHKKLNRFLRNFFNYGNYKISIVADSVSPKNIRLTTYLIEGGLTKWDRVALTSTDYNVHTVGNKNLVTGTPNMFLARNLESRFKKLRQMSKPEHLKEAKWHVPFRNNIDYTRLYFYVKANEKDFDKCSWCEELVLERYMFRIATTRCHEINNERTFGFEKDFKSYNPDIQKEALKHIVQAQNDYEIHEKYHGWKAANLFIKAKQQMKSISNIYKEAIELTHARSLRKIAAEVDPEGFKNKGKRVILPDTVPYMDLKELAKIPFPADSNANFSRVEETLRKAGYVLGKTLDEEKENYFKNICFKNEDFKNPTKIAKVLTALGETDYLQRFINDPYREAFISMQKDIEKGIKYKVLVSTLYLDVAGMSTDKKWTSCMNLGGKRKFSKGKDKHQPEGSNAEFIAKDIEMGTIVAYLIRTPYKSLDRAIDDSLARISIRPHDAADQDDYNVCYVAGPVYGIKNQGFIDIVKDYADKQNSTRVYRANPELYDETPLDNRYMTSETRADKLGHVLNDIALIASNNKNESDLREPIQKAEDLFGDNDDDHFLDTIISDPETVMLDEYSLASLLDSYLIKFQPKFALKLYLLHEIDDVNDFVDSIAKKKELANICRKHFDETSQDFVNLLQVLSSVLSTAAAKNSPFEEYLNYLIDNHKFQQVYNILVSSKLKIYNHDDNLDEYLDAQEIVGFMPPKYKELLKSKILS